MNDLDPTQEDLIDEERRLIRSFIDERNNFQSVQVALEAELAELEQEHSEATAETNKQFARDKTTLEAAQAGECQASEGRRDEELQVVTAILQRVLSAQDEAEKLLRSAGRPPSSLNPVTNRVMKEGVISAVDEQDSAKKQAESTRDELTDPMVGLESCSVAAQGALREVRRYLESAWLQYTATALMLIGGVAATGFGFGTHPVLGISFGGVAFVLFLAFIGRVGRTDSYLHMQQSVERARRFYERAGSNAQDSHVQRLVAMAAPHGEQLRELSRIHGERFARMKQRAADETVSHTAKEVEATQIHDYRCDQLRTLAVDLSRRVNSVTPPWEDSQWVEGVNAQFGATPSVLRFGSFSIGDTQHLEIPALTNFPPRRPMIWRIDGPERGRAAYRALQSLMLRMLVGARDGRVRFTFIDPVGRGENVAAFMALKDLDPELVTAKAWTERQDIEQQLRAITDHMEYVIQMRLRNEHDDIEAYNARAGALAEAYRVVVVFDFPTNFSDDAAQRLVSIAANGGRCGVHTFVLVDETEKLPYGFRLDDLLECGDQIALKDGVPTWQGYADSSASNQRTGDPFEICRLVLDAPPEPSLFNSLVRWSGVRALEAGEIRVSFDTMLSSLGEAWSWNSIHGIRAPLGPADVRNLLELEFGGDDPNHVHALVVGRTGSGKTNLLHVLILGLSLRYSPEELELYLIDFKQGIEFKPYATHHLPNARVVAIESEREFGLSVIEGLQAELERRAKLFREKAQVENITAYRTRTQEQMPRILLIVDEFQMFFTESDALSSRASAIIDQLVRQGRAYGIHVLLASQTLSSGGQRNSLASGTIGQIGMRIALQCTTDDARFVLADDNVAPSRFTRPGEAVYNDENGLVQGNRLFQVAFQNEDDKLAHLTRLLQLGIEAGRDPRRDQIVFEGSAPADVSLNRPLNMLISEHTATDIGRSPRAFLGEPIAIKPPTSAIFQRAAGNNLLIIGQDPDLARGMVTTAIVSLGVHALRSAHTAVAVYLIDFTPVDGEIERITVPEIDALGVTQVGRREITSVLQELAKVIQQRLDDEERQYPTDPIYLVIHGLQRARDLRPQEMYRSFDLNDGAEPDPSKLLASIVKDGPDCRVHTIVWCDTLGNVERAMPRNVWQEFAMKVVMQVSADDARVLVGDDSASRLGPNRAFFVHDDEGRVEKFRPYGPPENAWLSEVRRGCGGQSLPDHSQTT